MTMVTMQDIIPPYNINTISSKQVMRSKLYERIISWSKTKFSKLTSNELYGKQ